MKTKLLNSAKRSIPIVFLLMTMTMWSQTKMAGWTFNGTVAAAPNTPTIVNANFGTQSGDAMVFADGTNGSSAWITDVTGNELTSFTGTTLNDPRVNPANTRSYGLLGGTAQSANGKCIVFRYVMTGYEDAVLTYATLGIAGAFSNHQWAWSKDGVTFTNVGTNTADLSGVFVLKTVDLSAVTQVDNAPDVYLRLTVSGATSSTANTRIDNVVISASEQPTTFGSVTQENGFSCTSAPAVFNVTGLVPNSVSRITFNINGGENINAQNVASDASGNATFMRTLNMSNDGQLLTVTAVERTDYDGPLTPVTSNNTVVLNVDPNTIYYADADGDGYGDSTSTTLNCSGMPAGYVSNSLDCNDSNANSNPGMTEIYYNGFDDNCNGTIDEGNQITTQNYGQYCGITQQYIYSGIAVNYMIPNITMYRFRLQNLTNPDEPAQYLERGYSSFKLTDFAHYQYGTTYSIATELQRNGIWLGYYGPECQVTTPPVPMLQSCGMTVASQGTLVFSQVKLKITGYQFEVTRLITGETLVVNNGAHYFTFNQIPFYAPGEQYSVRVSVKTTDGYSAFGAACIITTAGPAPGSPAKENIKASTELTAVAYPNPYSGSFQLKLSAVNAPVQVKVFDMLGRVVEVRETASAAMDEVQFGQNYPSGIYNIVVTQGDAVQTLRVIRR